MSQPCKFCGQQIQMAKNAQGQWRPNNPDGSMHKCDRNQKPQSTEEHQEFESQKAYLNPAMQNEIRKIVKEELKSFLQWMASQAEGQA